MRRISATVVVILCLTLMSFSQTFRGAINGSVTDPSGAVVAGASVKATNVATGVNIEATTTSDGQFAFQDLPLGTYKITVAAAGFHTTTVDKIEVTAGSAYTLPVKLTVGGTGTTAVEVSAAALTLDTTTAAQDNVLTTEAVQDVPMNGRDFSQLIAVQPGYGGYSVGGFGSLNGTRANQMNWQIDGVDNNDFWHNIPAVNQGGVSGIAGTIMPLDAVDEFSAQTQSNAEGGRNAGGLVNVVLKSGTNQLHGSAYYFNRNEAFGDASPFTPDGVKKPELRNQNYGFSLGGPIIKDKTFWFVSFEKQQYVIGLSGVATEPSVAYQNEALAILANAGGVYGGYAPVTPSSISTQLIANLWPSTIDNLAANVNNFFSPVASTGYSYNGVAKIDHNFTDKHHLAVRWFAGQGSQTAPLGGSPALATASSNL
ncbi:MAG: carboxypeptidase-like regulatory domain-containing protein, partial [Candidatus Sulfotelmatobacter sp.]